MIQPEDAKNFVPSSSGWADRERNNSVSALEYLEFASHDMRDGSGVRHSINALSNAKRALHLCVEDLAEALGAHQGECKPNSPFPRKLDFCRRCGIASPRIIEKINKVRNRVEHEYYVPTRDETEDFLDIVTLFVHGSKRLIFGFPTDVEITLGQELFGMDTSWLHMEYAIGSGRLDLRWHHLEATEEELQRKYTELATSYKKAARAKSKKSERELYREASSEFWNVESATVAVNEGDKYFQWMTVYLDAAQS